MWPLENYCLSRNNIYIIILYIKNTGVLHVLPHWSMTFSPLNSFTDQGGCEAKSSKEVGFFLRPAIPTIFSPSHDFGRLFIGSGSFFCFPMFFGCCFRQQNEMSEIFSSPWGSCWNDYDLVFKRWMKILGWWWCGKSVWHPKVVKNWWRNLGFNRKTHIKKHASHADWSQDHGPHWVDLGLVHFDGSPFEGFHIDGISIPKLGTERHNRTCHFQPLWCQQKHRPG